MITVEDLLKVTLNTKKPMFDIITDETTKDGLKAYNRLKDILYTLADFCNDCGIQYKITQEQVDSLFYQIDNIIEKGY